MIQRSGRYHDGHSSASRQVTCSLYADGTLEIAEPGESGAPLRVPLREVRVSPRVGHTPRVLGLPGGASCELPDDDELDRVLSGARGSGFQRAVATLERHWVAALLALAASLAVLLAALELGVPALARVAANSLPAALDERLGEGALAALDERTLSASRLPPERQARVHALFDALARADGPDEAARLALRDGGSLGANALALPSGIVVVTDQLEVLASSDAQLSAVLAHELGHVAHRHALRGVLQDLGIGMLVSVALGDVGSISSLAAALPTLLLELEYSRRFEREADAHAVSLLRAVGIAPEALAEVLERLADQGDPTALPSYLSTHPDIRERVASARRAARPAEGG